jgi:uncharacterized RDD family membrane protein YckC
MNWVPFQFPKKREPHTGPYYASYNERVMAGAIDLVLLFYVLAPILQRLDTIIKPYFAANFPIQQLQAIGETKTSLGAQLVATWQVIVDSGVWQWMALSNLVAASAMGLALVMCQYFLRTTPGKWLFGLRITSANGETEPSLLQLVVRYVMLVISAATLMIGLIWIMFDKQSRGWHDMAAGTRVISMRPPGWYLGKIKLGWQKLRALMAK